MVNHLLLVIAMSGRLSNRENTNGHLVICQAAAVSFGVWFSLRKLIWLDSDNTHPPWVIELAPLTIQSASQNNEPSALSIFGVNMAGTFSQPAEYAVYDGSDSATRVKWTSVCFSLRGSLFLSTVFLFIFSLKVLTLYKRDIDIN